MEDCSVDYLFRCGCCHLPSFSSHGRYTVGKITPEPRHEIGPNDFGPRASIHMNFPKSGTPMTPTHNSSDFKWKDYCPMVFRLPISSSLFLCNFVIDKYVSSVVA